jgi:succinate dehydrogenase cytochrome b556 subunit
MIAGRPAGTIGMWPWFLQRLTGLALLFFLGVHMYVTHFGGVGLLTFHKVSNRFHSHLIFWSIFDGLFLLIAVFHALNGIRTIIYDFRPRPAARRGITISLWLVGIAGGITGLWILVPYIMAGT